VLKSRERDSIDTYTPRAILLSLKDQRYKYVVVGAGGGRGRYIGRG
jgi:cobalamin biosynthesis Co2+ chelatase CbiK